MQVIAGYKAYMIDKYSNVYDTVLKRTVQRSKSKAGYTVKLVSDTGVVDTLLVANLVAAAYGIAKPYKFKDGNKYHTALDNLVVDIKPIHKQVLTDTKVR